MPVDMRTVRTTPKGQVTSTATYEFNPEALLDEEYAADEKKNRDL